LPLHSTFNKVKLKFTFAHLRYYLGDHRPSETTKHTHSSIATSYYCN